MDLNIFVKNVYIFHPPAYTNITFYGSFHNSHEILTNWLMNVDNFVQRQSALLNISVTGPRRSPRKNRDLGPNAGKLIFFIKSKANRQKQNNNQQRDTPDGNVVLVSRAHKPNVIGNQETQ